MFSVLRKSRSLYLDIDLQLHLFDCMVSPILLYGSEVWGFEDTSVIVRFQLQYLKRILNVKSSTPNIMVFGELGVLPLDCMIKNRILNYWFKVINSKQDKICHIVYRLMLELHRNNIHHSPWITFVKESLEQLGFAEYWLNQFVDKSPVVFKNIVKTRIKDQYIQFWNEKLSSSNKCTNYRIYKSEFSFENYFKVLPRKLALSFCHFRVCNHKLPIEKGIVLNIERNNRICHMCNKNTLGDEFHYIFECSFFRADRKKYIPRFLLRPSAFNFMQLFQSDNSDILLKLAIFVKKYAKF